MDHAIAGGHVGGDLLLDHELAHQTGGLAVGEGGGEQVELGVAGAYTPGLGQAIQTFWNGAPASVCRMTFSSVSLTAGMVAGVGSAPAGIWAK